MSGQQVTDHRTPPDISFAIEDNAYISSRSKAVTVPSVNSTRATVYSSRVSRFTQTFSYCTLLLPDLSRTCTGMVIRSVWVSILVLEYVQTVASPLSVVRV